MKMFRYQILTSYRGYHMGLERVLHEHARVPLVGSEYSFVNNTRVLSFQTNRTSTMINVVKRLRQVFRDTKKRGRVSVFDYKKGKVVRPY